MGEAFYPVASTSACAQYHHHQLLVCAFEARTTAGFCMAMTLGSRPPLVSEIEHARDLNTDGDSASVRTVS